MISLRNDIFAAGVLLAIGAVFVVIIIGVLDSGGHEYDITMEYEDYIQLDPSIDVLGTNGPIEIVKIGSTKYIHGTGTGNAQIIDVNQEVTYIHVIPAKADIILMNGQSNAAYYNYTRPPAAEDVANTPTLPYGQAFYFGWSDGMPVFTGDNPSGCEIWDFMNPSTQQIRVCDKGPEFCRTYTDLTGKKAIWVSLGIPAKRIAAWNQPDGSAWVQDCRIMDYANTAIRDLPFEIDRVIVLWSQGESDYLHSTGYDHYVESFTQLTRAAPEGWGWDIDAWYLLPGRTAQVGWVNDAFAQLANTLDDVYLGSTAALIDSFSIDNGCMRFDDLHYTQLGDNALANAAARTAAGATGMAPVYLIQAEAETTAGTSISLPTSAWAYSTDMMTTSRITVSWSGTPDFDTAGTQILQGTWNTSVVDTIPHYAGPLLILTVTEASP